MASVLRNLLLEALDHDTFAVSERLPAAGFLQHCIVVQQVVSDSGVPDNIKTAKALISSPSSALNFAFVDRTADLKLAARCLLDARFSFKGTSSYAPDMVFVHEAVQKELSVNLVQIAETLTHFSTAARDNSDSKKEERTKLVVSTDEKVNGERFLSGWKDKFVLASDW